MKRMIMIAVVLISLIPTILIGYAVNFYAQDTIKTEKLEALTSIVHIMDVHLSRFFNLLILDIQMKTEEDALRAVLQTTEDSAGVGIVDRSEAQRVLTEYIGFPVIGGAIINTDGKILLSTQPEEEGLTLDKTELYLNIKEGKDSYIGLITIDGITDKYEIAVPIRDDQGKMIGILKQNVKPDILKGYLGSLNSGENYAFLIRKNGFMIFEKDKDNLASFYHEYQNSNSLEKLVSDFKTNELKEDKGIIEFENKGIEYIGAYENVKAANCIAVVATNRNEMYGSLIKVKAVIAAVILLVLIMIAICIYVVGDIHTLPLKMMNENLKKIANGDLTARCSYKGHNEFEELCGNINNLADSYQKNERELRLSSRIDSLTHLANRNAIYEVLDTLLYKHPNQALLLLDLEGFKEVNDNLGHDIGDRILMETGDILRALPQHVCYPSRLSGVEFLVFITNWTAPKYPEKIAEKIVKGIEGIRFIDEVHVDISASIGIEYTTDEKIDKKKLIKHSNIAMHKARLIGKNSYFVHYPYMQKE
ncbi:MAG TPA: diguanylate cyclase [Anaerovoracaceae bacterium]|nr:diguanylate cyclase [Anaerovoracaceae bacterium]